MIFIGLQRVQRNMPAGLGNNLSHNGVGQEREGLEGGGVEDDIRGAGRRGLLALDASEAAEGICVQQL